MKTCRITDYVVGRIISSFWLILLKMAEYLPFSDSVIIYLREYL